MYVASLLMADYDDPSLPLHTACYFPHLIMPAQPTSPPDHPAAADASPEYDTSDATPVPTRRPRGRPPGSKNKPKPPVVLTRDSPNSLRTHILEFSLGADILASLTEYTCQRGRGLSVLSGSGTVSDISLRHSGSSALLNLRGKFEITMLTGTVLPPPAPPSSGGLAVFMSGPQGQVVGGCVAGRLVAAGPVLVVAASFSNAVYERLPLTEESEEGGWEGRVGAGSHSSSATGSGGGWVRDGSSTGFGGLAYGGGELLGWAGNGVKAQFN
ncbi:hypothetical protein MLD38_022147 [Melastoma candidum]|uniref:Uncharacterized protein n=1 Tax=Melastoma candidum TaxID=119954 RepID=A0ACB9QK63_9MYRT|nr:hypothetical protein MLD38_022147 [Melastoma candidum]